MGKKYRKRRYKKWYRKTSAMDMWNMAKTAYTGVKYLKGLVNSETLKLDRTIATTVGTAGNVTICNDMAQSDGSSGRTGNSCLMKWLALRMKIIRNASSTNTNVRVLVVVDKQQLADTQPTVADVLELTYDGTYTLLKQENAGRFSVLYDKVFNLTGTSKYEAILKPNIRLGKNGLHVRYNGPASTDIQKNGVYVMVVSDEATNQPTVNALIRLGYHDN